MYNRIWCSALVVLAVVVWSWAASCVHCVKVTVGHNDARNMLRQKFDNKHQISCIFLVSLSSPYVHDARSQEPKKSTNAHQ